MKESNKDFNNFSSSEEKQAVIPSKKNMNLKKEKSVENIKISANNIEQPINIEENKFNSLNNKYQRSNKKR